MNPLLYTQCACSLPPFYFSPCLLVLLCLACPWPQGVGGKGRKGPRCWGHVTDPNHRHRLHRSTRLDSLPHSLCASSSQCHRYTRSRSCAGQETQSLPGLSLCHFRSVNTGRASRTEDTGCMRYSKRTLALHYLAPQIHTYLAFWFPDILHSPFNEHSTGFSEWPSNS